MAITSYPFENQDTTENQYTELFRELADDGIADSAGGTGFQVVSTGGLTVGVQPGFAIVRGHAIKSTAVESITVPSNSQETIHRIILKLDPASNSITVALKAGVAGAGAPPAMTRSDYGIQEFSLATVTVPASASGIGGSAIVDDRRFLGAAPSAWPSTSARPSNPRKGCFGYNVASDRFEYFNGTEWKPASPTGTHIQFGQGTIDVTNNDTWYNVTINYSQPFASAPKLSLTPVNPGDPGRPAFLAVDSDHADSNSAKIIGKRPAGEGTGDIIFHWIAVGVKAG